MKKEGVTILGSTGSIGVNTLEVISLHPDRFQVVGLSCHSSIELLASQIRTFSPKAVAVAEGKGDYLKHLLNDFYPKPQILEGAEGLVRLAQEPSSSRLVAAIVGAAAIEPVMAGVRSGQTIALANKECIALAGSLLISEARKHDISILPLDSEHNGVFQLLRGENKKEIYHIILTASGGPFRQRKLSDFKSIRLEEALNHPNWKMGRKITIDSATMMNKCLEIIEAKWLFDLEPEQIRTLIHPQSIVHAIVTFKDGSTLAQMGVPDMKTPIANCLGYPERIESGSNFLDLGSVANLSFEEPDLEKFPTLEMAQRVLKLEGGAPAALNGGNEALVELFLEEKIHFTDIFKFLKILVKTLEDIYGAEGFYASDFPKRIGSVEDALAADAWGRKFIRDYMTMSKASL